MWVNANWHIAIWHFLQDVISLLNTHIVGVELSSQYALIDDTNMPNIQILQR